jgi:hypothetical protein
MASVEIRLPPADVSARLAEVRLWLSTRGATPVKFTSTGSSDEAVIVIEFASSDEAEAFARQFSGALVGG